jgi:hypothetical protein
MDGWMAAKVYKLSIGAACELEWPSERFMIQVLDDSTDPVVKVRTPPSPTLFLTPVAGPFCDLRGQARPLRNQSYMHRTNGIAT